MMKIGVIVEMLRQPLRDGIRTAAEIGCQGIQTYGINEEFNLLDRTPAEARDLAKYIRDCGLELVSVAGDMPGHGYTRAAEVAQKLRDAGWEIVEERSSEGWFSYLCK